MNYKIEKKDYIIDVIPVDVGAAGHITNCYILYDKISLSGILVDPGYDSAKIINEIETNKIKIEYIVLTHCHGDHLGALEELQKYTKTNIIIHKLDVDGIYDDEKNYSSTMNVDVQNVDRSSIIPISDGDNFNIGNMEFELIHTPGHTSGGICIYEKKSNVLITGDTIFSDCYGRTDLKSGDFEQMQISLEKIFKRFKGTEIYPGHGDNSSIESAKKRIKLLLAIKKRKMG